MSERIPYVPNLPKRQLYPSERALESPLPAITSSQEAVEFGQQLMREDYKHFRKLVPSNVPPVKVII